MQKVNVQASRHCTRADMSDFYNIVRPNEEKIFIEWRNSNKRHITAATILSFKRMLQRVFRSSINIPDLKKEQFDNLYDFLFEEIISLILLDPNAGGIEWPFNPDSPDTPLSEPNSFPQNKVFKTKTIIYNFDSIVLKSEDIFIACAGTMNVGTEKQPVYANYYIGCDKEHFYQILPHLIDKEIIYDTKIWYTHSLNRMPVFSIPGVKIGNYQESYAWGAYEILDEVIISLSSDQINRIRNVLPKLVVNADLVCPTCNGAGVTDHFDSKDVCKTCVGSGSLREIGDFSTVNVRAKSEFDRANTNPVFYVQQPSDLRYSKEVWEGLLDQANKQLCTDLLEGTGNESSIAKDLRLEPRQDLLVSIGEQLCHLIEAYINNRQQLINQTEKYITVVPPAYYETKTPDMLKLYVEQALPGERQRNYMMYVKNKYLGNDFIINVHLKAILYAPLLLYKTEEADSVIAMGAYEAQDIKRRDYAIMVLTEVMMLYPKLSNKELFEKADELLKEWGIINEEVEDINIDEITSVEDLPDDLDELEEVLTKLLHNEIDREYAKKIIMIIENMDEEAAEQLLIDTDL